MTQEELDKLVAEGEARLTPEVVARIAAPYLDADGKLKRLTPEEEAKCGNVFAGVDLDVVSTYTSASGIVDVALDSQVVGSLTTFSPYMEVNDTYASAMVFMEHLLELVESVEDVPLSRRWLDCQPQLAVFCEKVKNHPRFKRTAVQRYLHYVIQSPDNDSPYLPVGMYVDAGVINQQHPVVKAAKQQYGRHWRSGVINIFALGD